MIPFFELIIVIQVLAATIDGDQCMVAFGASSLGCHMIDIPAVDLDALQQFFLAIRFTHIQVDIAFLVSAEDDTNPVTFAIT